MHSKQCQDWRQVNTSYVDESPSRAHKNTLRAHALLETEFSKEDGWQKNYLYPL